MSFDPARLVVLVAEEAVRQRASLYFGVGRDDPRLPEQILRHVVEGTMWVPPARDSLEIVVTIEDDLVFSVRDNGQGMSPHSRHRTRRPDPEHMLTEIHGGHYDRGGQIGIAGTLCSQVKVWTRWERVEYATEMDADRNVSPLRELGPSSAEGTEIQMRLNADFFAPGSRLPTPLRELQESLLGSRKRVTDRLTIVDRRR